MIAAGDGLTRVCIWHFLFRHVQLDKHAVYAGPSACTTCRHISRKICKSVVGCDSKRCIFSSTTAHLGFARTQPDPAGEGSTFAPLRGAGLAVLLEPICQLDSVSTLLHAIIKVAHPNKTKANGYLKVQSTPARLLH